MKYILFLTALIVLGLTPLSVTSSQEIEKILKEQRNKEVPDESGIAYETVDSSSIYGKMFLDRFEYTLLVDWATTGFNPRYIKNKFGKNHQEEYIISHADIVTDRYPKAQLTIVIPHPKNQVAARYKLLEPYIGIEPFESDIKSYKKFTISGRAGTSFYLRNNLCRILFDLPHQGILKVDIKKCKTIESPNGIANELTIERLIRKLQS